MPRSRGIGIGIPFWSLTGLPFKVNLLRFLRPRDVLRIYDLIGDYDAEEPVENEYDLNPDDDVDAGFALQCMNKDNVTIWGGTDANGDTIRDLPGYNPLDPYEWLDAEMNVDIFNTYLSDAYTGRIFGNFFDDTTDLAVYDRQMTCAESRLIHGKLQTGGWWILNRAVWNDCGKWKDSAVWRDS